MSINQQEECIPFPRGLFKKKVNFSVVVQNRLLHKCHTLGLFRLSLNIKRRLDFFLLGN